MTITAMASRLARQIHDAGDTLFGKDDAFAGRHGWTIEVRRCGLARAYRDPRFDDLIRCPDCGGHGSATADLPCGRCAGTGRATLCRRPGLIRR